MKALVVDDEPVMRRVVERTLTDMGVEAVSETSGLNALYRVHEQPFDLVFMDLMMPGGNGVYAIEEVLKRRPGTRIVAITGLATDEIVAKALERCAESRLRKPFSTHVIRETVERVRRESDGGTA